MRKRYGKFLADWRDENGRRKRKALATKKAALRFQNKMQHQVAAKKAHASAASRKSAKPGPRRTPSGEKRQ